jgi:hypothetical protein
MHVSGRAVGGQLPYALRPLRPEERSGELLAHVLPFLAGD